jgi:hypothetical protein
MKTKMIVLFSLFLSSGIAAAHEDFEKMRRMFERGTEAEISDLAPTQSCIAFEKHDRESIESCIIDLQYTRAGGGPEFPRTGRTLPLLIVNKFERYPHACGTGPKVPDAEFYTQSEVLTESGSLVIRTANQEPMNYEFRKDGDYLVFHFINTGWFSRPEYYGYCWE